MHIFFQDLGSHHHHDAPHLGQEGQSPKPPKGTGKGPAKGGKGPPAKGKARGKEVPVVRCIWCVGKGGVVVRSNLIFLQVWEESVVYGAGSRNRKNLETI